MAITSWSRAASSPPGTVCQVNCSLLSLQLSQRPSTPNNPVVLPYAPEQLPHASPEVAAFQGWASPTSARQVHCEA